MVVLLVARLQMMAKWSLDSCVLMVVSWTWYSCVMARPTVRVEMMRPILSVKVSRILYTLPYRDYAHPYCMLQSSYRWNGLNFENSSFASKLCPLMKKLTVCV